MFSQERAPTSVAYAENQSMFLDSLVGDAAWRAKYARDINGNPIPFEIHEEGIRSTHPFQVFQLRAMLSVSYFEKALYELPEADLTPANVQALADKIENEIQGGLSARPLLSVPHLVSDEASCYYQGYTLAEMSVHQTRAFFKEKYGYIVKSSMTKDVSILVNESGIESSKTQRAVSNGITIVTDISELLGENYGTSQVD